MRSLRDRLTYANVVSSIALFLALTGGAVYAAGKIGSDDIAANAIKSKQIAPKAVKASDMATPVSMVARANGGSAAFVNGEIPYPLTGKTKWTQGPQEIDQFMIEANGSASPDPSNMFPICFASVKVFVNGILVTSAPLNSASSSGTGVGFLPDGGSKVKRTITATLQSSSCSSTSRVDSVKIRAIGTG